MVRPYGRGWKGKRSKQYDPEWLKFGGTVLRKGYVVVVRVNPGFVVLRAWSDYSRTDVRQLRVPADVWFGVSVAQREKWVEMALRRPVAGAQVGPRDARSDLDVFRACPVLRSYLLDRRYEDGTARQTATLTLFLNDQGLLGAILKDRATDLGLFGVGASLDELAESLEEQLTSAEPGWRADRAKEGNSKRVRPTGI